MSRKVFDKLTSAGGMIVVVVLIVAGGLMTWGHSFVNSNVHTQLAEQQIYFPAKSAWAHAKPGTEITPQMIPYLEKYSGKELLTGAEAEAYADHFIAYHLAEMPYHGVYSTVSAASIANPKNAALTAEKTTSFMGTTLRGLLLEAYAFSEIGAVMLFGAIASFILAALMAVLVVFGFWHAARASDDERLFAAEPHGAPEPHGASLAN
jgi:hypothetical protein